MIESAPMLETLNKSSLNRPRPITVSEYSANKLSSCLATPGLTSGEASLASSAMASHRLAPTFAANTGNNNNDSSDCTTPRSYHKPTTPTATHRVYNSNIKPTTRFKITCKSSNYNSKDIANSLYDIDDHLNKDLIYDFFFNDNYMLDNLTLNSNNYSCVNTFKDKENYNSNSNVNTNQPWALHRTETSSNNLSTRDYNSIGNHQPTNTSTNTNNNNSNNTSSNSTSNNNINTNNSNSNNSNNSSNNNSNNGNSNNNSTNNYGSSANNNNNSGNGGKQTLIAWENSTNKCMQFSDWNDGLNEWCAMPPYPSLKIYMNSIKNRRGPKQRTEVEFDEQLGLYLPTFKIIQKQLQQQQQQQQQQKEQLQQLQQQSTDTNYHHHHHQHQHQHGNNNQHSSHQQNHPSTRLIKELHKLVNSNPNNNTPLVKFDENNNSGQTSNLSNTSTSSIVNKKELQLQQQFIYVNSIINDQRQQQQQQLHSSNQLQRQNSGHMKRSLHVRAAFPSLMNNNSNNNTNYNINNTNNSSTSNISNQLNHVENNNASSANTLLATQLLQLRSDEIDRLTQSAKNNSATNLANVINSQNQIHHSHASLSASSLLKQSNMSNNSSSALTPNSVTLHHAASTNSVANKTAPLIVGDDMNLIRVKKITQQPTEASPSQDNITKQLLMNNAVQQQIQSNLVRNKTDNTSDNHNLSISNNTNALLNHKNNNSNNNNNNHQKQTNQIISISSSSNLNASNSNLIGTPNAKVYKAAQPITTASMITPNASSSSSSSSTTSSTSTSAGSMSSTSQSASQSSHNASTLNSYTAYQSNDPRYRQKSTDDELSSHGNDYLAKQQKNSSQKVIVPVTLSSRYNPATPNTSSLLTTNLINSKHNNDTILNPFFVNQTSNTLISENTQILLNSADVIIAHQNLPQQQQQLQQQQQHHQHHQQPQPQQHAMTAALPPIISGKRINLPLGPHRRRIVMDYLDSGGKLNKQQGSITCRKNKNGAGNPVKSARVTRSTSFQETKSKLPSSASSRSLPKSLLNSDNGIKTEMQSVSVENEPKCRKVIAKSHKQPNPPAAVAVPASKDKNIKIVNSILIRSHTFYF